MEASTLFGSANLLGRRSDFSAEIGLRPSAALIGGLPFFELNMVVVNNRIHNCPAELPAE